MLILSSEEGTVAPLMMANVLSQSHFDFLKPKHQYIHLTTNNLV